MKPNILILTNHRRLDNGPRIIREVNALKDEFTIYAAGMSAPHDNDVNYIPFNELMPNLPERAIHKVYRKVTGGQYLTITFPSLQSKVDSIIEQSNPSIIIIHDIEFMPYLFKIKDKMNFKIVYNAHEYHPLQFDSNKKWLATKGKYYTNMYNKYLKYIDLMVNVCDGIALKCKEVFGKDSIVLPNAATYNNISPKYTAQDSKVINVITHGAAIRARHLDIMIDAIEAMHGKYHLDVILMPVQQEYYDELVAKIKDCKYVAIKPPIKFEEITNEINKYDIGLFNLPPLTFNYKNALPNKLFEFIQAKLCVVISDSPEMKKIVENHHVGFVSKGYDKESLINVLQSITIDDINKCKEKCIIAAQELAAENYYTYYLKNINQLLLY